jgi:DNA modification methylase
MQGDLLGGATWHVHHGDCIEHMAEMPPCSVDFAAYSPPFPSVFAYTSSEADLGNSEGLTTDAKLHFGFFFKSIVRVMKPGRVMMVHCTQIPRMKRAGGRGLFDFRGMLIRLGERAGFTRLPLSSG